MFVWEKKIEILVSEYIYAKIIMRKCRTDLLCDQPIFVAQEYTHVAQQIRGPAPHDHFSGLSLIELIGKLESEKSPENSKAECI